MKVALKRSGYGAAHLPAAVLTVIASLLTSGCATSPAPARVPPIAVPALALPADGVELRRPPGIERGSLPHVDFYPAAEHRASATGRVLVQFGLDAAGKATSPHVVQANATQGLQDAAVKVVRVVKFDLTDPKYNSADPAPNYLLVTFCIERCGPLPAYPAEEVTITGSRMKTS
jgi:TonB family protein